MFEHQAAFTETLRVGREMRKRIFDTLEQRHARDFGNGRAGVRLYEDLISAVRDTGVPEAAQEFEKRFFPLLNPDRPHGEVDFGPPEEMTYEDQMIAGEKRRGGGWGWKPLSAAALIVGVLVLGFQARKMTAAEPPTAIPVPAAQAIEPSPAAQAIEPSSETMIEPAPATAAEQEQDSSSER